MVLTSLWVVPVADLGGVARHVLDVARTGIPGVRLVVLCPEGPLAEQLRALGTPVLTGPVSPADGPAAATRTIRRVLGRLGPDVLHTHLAFADLTGVAAAAGRRSGRGRRVRVVSTEHGISGVRGLYQSGAARARVTAGAHTLRLRRTDAVIAVSASTREQVLAQWGSGARVVVVRNAVDVPEPHQHRAPGLRVLSLSRLAPEKRIDHLLRAVAALAEQEPAATLTVAGAGPEEEALRGLAAELGLGERVRFVGHVDAATALAGHDVLAQLSVWENLSYSLLDAAAHGLGVVATDVGGNREIVPERCLVDAEDPTAVAAALRRQGLDLDARPEAPPADGGVAGMSAAIGAVYREVAA